MLWYAVTRLSVNDRFLNRDFIQHRGNSSKLLLEAEATYDTKPGGCTGAGGRARNTDILLTTAALMRTLQ